MSWRRTWNYKGDDMYAYANSVLEIHGCTFESGSKKVYKYSAFVRFWGCNAATSKYEATSMATSSTIPAFPTAAGKGPDCNPCVAGRYSPWASHVCTLCSVGKYVHRNSRCHRVHSVPRGQVLRNQSCLLQLLPRRQVHGRHR
jgi:hypothetical protein